MGTKVKDFLEKNGLVIGIVVGQIYSWRMGRRAGIKWAKQRTEMTMQKYVDIKPEIATLIDEANKLMEKKEIEIV